MKTIAIDGRVYDRNAFTAGDWAETVGASAAIGAAGAAKALERLGTPGEIAGAVVGGVLGTAAGLVLATGVGIGANAKNFVEGDLYEPTGRAPSLSRMRQLRILTGG